jgi:hypothetical protein
MCKSNACSRRVGSSRVESRLVSATATWRFGIKLKLRNGENSKVNNVCTYTTYAHLHTSTCTLNGATYEGKINHNRVRCTFSVFEIRSAANHVTGLHHRVSPKQHCTTHTQYACIKVSIYADGKQRCGDQRGFLFLAGDVRRFDDDADVLGDV